MGVVIDVYSAQSALGLFKDSTKPGQHHLPRRSYCGCDVHSEHAGIALAGAGAGAGDGVTTEVSRQITSRADAAADVEWAAVFAGAVLAAALSFVLLTFGTAIGLSATSPWPNSALSAKGDRIIGGVLGHGAADRCGDGLDMATRPSTHMVARPGKSSRWRYVISMRCIARSRPLRSSASVFEPLRTTRCASSSSRLPFA